jgi:hypothetical protein
MNSLVTSCLKQIVKSDISMEDINPAVLDDAVAKFAQDLGSRLRRKKERHFFELCRLYLVFYVTRRDDLVVTGDVAYQYMPNTSLPHWQLAQWCACEIVFGHYHTAEDAVARIRMELPFEHVNDRFLDFTLEAFEQSLKENCPNMKGNVHDWYKVFMNVPTKILEYEEFFG